MDQRDKEKPVDEEYWCKFSILHGNPTAEEDCELMYKNNRVDLCMKCGYRRVYEENSVVEKI